MEASKLKAQSKHPRKIARFTLNTRYGYEHLGIDTREGEKTPFPTLLVISKRADYLNRLIFKKAEVSNKAQQIFDQFNNQLDEIMVSLNDENKALDELMCHDASINNIDYSTINIGLQEPCEFSYMPSTSTLIWKGIRTIIAYDKVVLAYLKLLETAAIDKKEGYLKIKKCGSLLRKALSNFNMEAKALLNQTKAADDKNIKTA